MRNKKTIWGKRVRESSHRLGVIILEEVVILFGTENAE